MSQPIATFDAEDGLVLCRAGADCIAVRATEVASIEASMPALPYAGLGQAPVDGKTLKTGSTGVVVDALEIITNGGDLLAVPSCLHSMLGGSLCGFALVRAQLWPVVTLSQWVAFLERRA